MKALAYRRSNAAHTTRYVRNSFRHVFPILTAVKETSISALSGNPCRAQFQRCRDFASGFQLWAVGQMNTARAARYPSSTPGSPRSLKRRNNEYGVWPVAPVQLLNKGDHEIFEGRIDRAAA